MKRWLLRILVFLLLGAIMNVAIAWGLAAFIDPNQAQVTITRQFLDKACVEVCATQARPGHSRTSRISGDPFCAEWHSKWLRSLRETGSGPAAKTEDSSGWPWLALTCHAVEGVILCEGSSKFVSSATPVDQIRVAGGIAVGSWQTGPVMQRASMAPKYDSRLQWRALPYRPLWPGFAINTLFYALASWLLFATFVALRQRWRIKLGLCPKCAYDLRGIKDTEKCPECGSIVAS